MVKQRRLGKTELMVSEVALGALEIGAMYGIGEDAGKVPAESEAFDMMQAALDAGITLFDTAGGYGLSELRIGRFIRKTKQRPVITTKLMVRKGDDGKWIDYAARRPYDTVEACVDHQVQRSVLNLGVDAVDVMQLHGLPDAAIFDDVTSTLQKHVKAGRIRHIGVSCGGKEIPRLAKMGYSTVQLSANMLNQDEFDTGLELAKEHDFGVLVRSPLALGVLAGRTAHMKGDPQRRQRYETFLSELKANLPEGMSVPEAALRFLLSSSAVTSVLTGTRKAEHIRANAMAGDGEGLPEDLFLWIRRKQKDGDLPQWSWKEHRDEDWPQDSDEANLKACREADAAAQAA